MIKKVLLSSVLVLSLWADSCWTQNEVAEFAQDEFDEITRFSIKDAVSCEPVADALFSIGSKTYRSDAKGIVTLPLPDEDKDESIKIKIEKEGYITADEHIMTLFGSYWNNLFLMSKDIPLNSARFTLSWGSTPSDLDLHLISESYHISYRKTRSIINKVQLDRDAMRGYGPETITLDMLDKDETYRVVIYRYSDGAIDNKTQVRVYLNNKLDNVLRMKNTQERCLEVATITNNQISYETKILDENVCK